MSQTRIFDTETVLPDENLSAKEFTLLGSMRGTRVFATNCGCC
jgi:hypothetical protein